MINIAFLYKISGELILSLPNVCTQENHYIEDIEREAVTFCVPLNVHYKNMTYKMNIKLLTPKLKKTSKINQQELVTSSKRFSNLLKVTSS